MYMLKIPVIVHAVIISILGISLLFSGSCVIYFFLKDKYWDSLVDTTSFITFANGFVIGGKWIPYLGMAEIIFGVLILYAGYLLLMYIKKDSDG